MSCHRKVRNAMLRWFTAPDGRNGVESVAGARQRIPSLAIVFLALMVGALAPAAGGQAGGWTWMGGASTAGQQGVDGTLGMPATGNIPGNRAGAATSTDSSGRLWLFGGEDIAVDDMGWLNDLWELDPSTKEWTWMSGSSPSSCASQPCGPFGVYGSLGTPAPGNVPGGRLGASSWIDSSGNFWLFGGQGFAGYDASGALWNLNDLWEFDPLTGEWTWMAGDSTVDGGFGHPGVYGAQGTPAAGNHPGSRSYANSWTGGDGHFWLFGGYGADANGNDGPLNDLWEFDPASGEWTWMGGSSTVASFGFGQPGVYGSFAVPAAGNIPGGRYFASSWMDGSGNVWLFGGNGVDANGVNAFLNDLWEFNPSNGEWTWVSGSSTVSPATPGPNGVYGILGVPAAVNTPGGRVSVAGWADGSGNLWMFGGFGVYTGANCNLGYLNDLWEFDVLAKQWTWIGGSNTAPWTDGGNPGVYGTLGTAGARSIPGSRYNAANWMDSSGNLSLFGGIGFDSNGNSGILNDLWEYQPTAAPVSLSAPGISFGPMKVGATSAAQSLTMTNLLKNALPIHSIGVTGANPSSFVIANSCGSSLRAGASCTIHGHFVPREVGALTAAVTIWAGAGSSPQRVALSGTGLGLPPMLTASSLSFGSVNVGSESALQTVTVTNTGSTGLPVVSIAVTGANASSFAFTNSCGTMLAAVSSCIIQGRFTPTALGALTAAVTIGDDAFDSPQSIALSGSGVNVPVVSLSAGKLSFGTVSVGGASATQSVTLTNTGTAALSIASLSVTGANASSSVFANSCGTKLAAGANCTINGYFAPTAVGALKAAIAITDDATDSPQTIALSGTAVGVPGASLSAGSLPFGTLKIGAASASQSVTLTNTGSGTLSISSIGVTGKNASSFVFASSCGTSLAVKASCIIHGHFTPTAAGALTAAVTIMDNGAGSPQGIALSGKGQ